MVYRIFKINARSTTIHSDKEVEHFYKDLEKTIQVTHYTIITDDFNAKMGFKQDHTEVAMGNYGMTNEINEGKHYENLSMMNSFFDKKTSALMDMDKSRWQYQK